MLQPDRQRRLAAVFIFLICFPVNEGALTCPAGTGTSTQTLSPYNLGIGNGDLNAGTGPTTCSYAAPQGAFGAVALAATVNSYAVPQGVQTWTVGTTGTYFLVAAGAAGSPSSTNIAGYGAVVSNTYTFTKGQTVAISVGVSPNSCLSSGFQGGGGGTFVSIYAGTGSFATASQHTPVLVAGGGGGAGTGAGANAVVGTSGTLCPCCSGTVASNGGGGGGGNTNGGNGAAGSSTNSIANAAGGGGFYYKGGDAYASNTLGGSAFVSSTGPTGGSSMSTGSAACTGQTGVWAGPFGGFGGGGGSWNAGGGGGGYSGGQGAPVSPTRCGGGGGGSYDASNSAGGYAATQYTSWNSTLLGAAPSTFAAGYSTGSGFVYIVPTSNCIGCGAGTFSSSGVSCTNCAANTYSASSAAACTACPSNSWSGTGAGRCIANVGYFGPTLYMFDGVNPSYSNIGSDSSHVISSVSYNPTFSTVGSKYGAYFNSAANNGYLTVSNNYNTVSLSFWMYFTGTYVTTTAYQFGVFGLVNSALNSVGFNFETGNSGGGTGFAWFWAVYGGSWQEADFPAGSIPQNTWVHVVLVVPSGSDRKQRAYLNGVRVGISASAGPSDIANFQVLSVGAYPTESRYYQGYLSKVAMYNYAMSDTEVATLYSSGTTPTPFIACSTTSITCTTGTVHCSPSGTPVCCGVGTYFVEGVSTSCQPCAPGTYGFGNTTACATCASGLSSPAGVGSCCPANTYIVAGTTTCTACPANTWSAAGDARCTANVGYYDLGNSLKAYYPFNNGNMLSDVSGVLGALTTSSSPTPQAAGPFGASSYSASFGGTNFFQMPSLTVTSTFSVCAWAYINSGVTANYQNIFDFSVYPSANDFVMYLNTDTTLHVNNVIPGTSLGDMGTSALTKGAWFHICSVVSGTSGTLWVNGASSGSVTYTSASPTFTLPSNRIGTNNGGQAMYFWNRAMDEFRVYNKALSAAEISAIYNFRGDTYTPVLPLQCTMTGCSGTVHCTPAGSPVCCTTGQYFVEGNSTSCQPCASGTYGFGNTTACATCASGLSSPAGVGNCCPANTYIVPGTSTCTACPANTWSYAGASSCTANAGYYNIDNSLLSYYNFLPSNIYADNSGNGMTLTSINGATYTPTLDASTGPFAGAGAAFLNNAAGNNAAAYTTSGFRISVGSGLSLYNLIGTQLTPGPGFSFCYWLRGADGPTTPGVLNTIQWQNLFGFYTGGPVASSNANDRMRYMVYANTGPNVYWEIYSGSNPISSGTSTGLPISLQYSRSWNHVCQVFQGRSLNIYANCASSTCTPQSSFTLGGDFSNVLYTYMYLGQSEQDMAWYGWLSEVRLYKKALSAAEVYAVASYSTVSAVPMIEMKCPTITCTGGTIRCTPSGGSVCCTAGQYFVEGVSTSCQACPSGTYGSGNATACTACAAGTYSAAGSSACIACPANTGSAAGAAGCLPGVGYYVATTANRFPSSGMTSNTNTINSEVFNVTSSSQNGPVAGWCALDSIASTGSMAPNLHEWCTSSAGYTSGAYTAGTYSTLVDGSSYPGEWLQLQTGVPRQLGSYSIRASYSYFTRSPANFIVAGSNDGNTWTKIDSQTAGAWSSSSVQTFNPVLNSVKQFIYFRMIITTVGASSDGYLDFDEWMLYTGALNTCSISGCTAPTPNGECSTSGSTICCATGTYWVPSSSTAGCTACPLGTYASASTTACTSCAAGFFSSVTGASVCSQCAAGTTSLTGSSSCPLSSGGTAAPVGQYWSGSGYVACPTNSFCSGGAAAPQTCTVCAAGSYTAVACNASADTNCTACGSGKFSSATNASVCTSCSTCTPGQSVGTSCTASTNTVCLPCASGTYGTTGVTCNACSAGLNSPVGSTACSASYPVYALVADYYGNTLRKVNLDGTTVSTVASSGLSSPAGVSISNAADFVLVVNGGSQTVSILYAPNYVPNLLAGSPGVTGSTDGVGAAASFNYPVDVKLSLDNTYALVSESVGHIIRKVFLNGTTVHFAGTPGVYGYQEGSGSSSMFYGPTGMDISPAGDFALVTEFGGNRIRKLTLTGNVPVSSLVAGSTAGYIGTAGGTDGIGSSALFYYPRYVIISSDATFALVMESTVGRVRKIILATQTVSTITTVPAGSSVTGISFTQLMDNVIISAFGTNVVGNMAYPSGTYSILAGTGTAAEVDSATALTAQFNAPNGLAIWKCKLTGYGLVTSNTCSQCAINTYGTGNGTCSPCSSGMISAAGSSVCSTGAPAGQYYNGVSFLACPSGSFCLGGSSAPQTCSICNAGSFILSNCTSSANTVCGTCQAGVNYTTVANATACSLCTVCVSGQYTSSACTSTSNANCAACPSGSYCPSPTTSTVTACVQGTNYCPAGSTAPITCNVCAAGTRLVTSCNTTSPASCTACVSGSTYSTTTNSATCTSCSSCVSGQYTSSPCTATSDLTCTLCPAGSYCGTPVVTSPTACSTTYYCAAGSTAQTLCLLGSYCPNTSSQITCSLGSFCVAGSIAPQPCAAGSYCSSPSTQVACAVSNYCPAGSTSPGACPQGFYCSGPSTKTACSSTYYCPTNSSAQTLCLQDFYCPNTYTQTSCTSTNYCPTGSTSQTLCALGSYCPNLHTQTPCSAGSYCAAGSTAPQPCSAGFYCATPSSQTACTANNFCLASVTAPTPCTVCSAGNYTSSLCTASSNAVCTSCTAGVNYSPSSNALSCTTCGVCAVGQYVTSACSLTANVSCATCPLGSVCPTTTTVTACTPGQFCPAGSTSPQTCAAGYYCPNATVQIACPAGSFCLAGSSAPATCTVCAAGKYRSTVCTSTSDTVCPSCTSGSTFSTTTNAASCTGCNACSGQFVSTACTVNSDAVCSACPAGNYCPNSSAVITCDPGNVCLSGSTTQSPCPAGFVCTTPATQVACQLSYYCPARTTLASKCAVGSYCANTSSQIACASGSFCPQGSTNQTTCQAGNVCADPTQSVACNPGSFCPAGTTSESACRVHHPCYENRMCNAKLLPCQFNTAAAVSCWFLVRQSFHQDSVCCQQLLLARGYSSVNM